MIKRMRIFLRVLKDTGADKIWLSFVIQFFVLSVVIWRVEPEVKTYEAALWYSYSVVTTVGFGDVVVQHFLSRIISVWLSLNAVVVFAIITGVIVNYYNRITELKQKETLVSMMHKLEKLPDLSKEELEELSRNVSETLEKM